MESYNADSSLIRAALDDLPEYLTSKTLFWPLYSPPGEFIHGGLPRLTPGNLLLAMKRLQAGVQLNAVVAEKIHQAVNKNRAIWLNKINLEFASRLRMWQNELGDFSREKGPDKAYHYQIRQRAILRLLELEMTSIKPSDAHVLDQLDEINRKITVPSAFLWEDNLSEGFPPDEWWFLYRDLASNQHGNEVT